MLGASAGGPQALPVVLRGLAGLPVAVVIAQHQNPDFAGRLADLLRRESGVDIRPAEHGAVVTAGSVLIGPPDRDLRIVRGGRVQLVPNASHHHPSIDALFTSVAASHGATAVGIILTGMGADGAAGLLALREAGAVTIAQDRATSAVYGMPSAAVRNGAALLQLPLEGIAQQVQRLVGGRTA